MAVGLDTVRTLCVSDCLVGGVVPPQPGCLWGGGQAQAGEAPSLTILLLCRGPICGLLLRRHFFLFCLVFPNF